MPERIRIIEIVFSLDVELGGGGITRFTLGLVEHLDPLKFEVTLCSLSGYQTQWSHERIEHLNSLGIRFLDCGPWLEDKPLRSFSKALAILREDVKQHHIDILHSHSEFADVAAVFLRLSTGVPAIIRTVHNGYFIEWRKKPWRRYVFTNFLFPLVYEVEIGVNQSITDRLNQRFLARVFKRKALTIPNALDLNRFTGAKERSPNIRQSLSIPDDAFVIGTVGRLTEEKGYDIFINAAGLVLQERPDVYFVVIGGGPLENVLRSQANRSGVASHVIFLGPRPDIESLLSSLDLFVCTSLWEGSPTAVLESMAAGIPVLASDIPGIRTMIRHSENGWLVMPGNAQEFSEAMINLLNSPGLREHLVVQAAETVHNFSIDAITRQNEAVYLRKSSKVQL